MQDMGTDLTGQQIKDYTLSEMLGRGGFGAVYRAKQNSVDRDVAIKIILPKYANDPNFIRRFESEAQIIARLEHLHIVPLYDYWRDASGAYLVMRHLRGGSLKETLRRNDWDVLHSARVVHQIASALSLAHKNNIIHRDIKPANILLDDEGNAYLSDFGISKILRKDEAAESSHRVLGSPAYIAPEWVQHRMAIPALDQYSLAIVTFELLAGTHPYADRETPVAMLQAHLYDPLPPLNQYRPDLPDDLDTVLLKATAKKPDERYKDVMAFERALRHALKLESRAIAQITTDLIVTGLDETIVLETDAEQEQDGTRQLVEGLNTPLEPLPQQNNPYRGLRPFQEADASVFHGRNTLTQSLIERFRSQDVSGRFIALVGASGSGKSSVVRAGLIPRLRNGALPKSDEWFFLDMLPGENPLEELEAGLLSIAVNPPPSLLEQLKSDTHGLLRAVNRSLPRDDDSELLLFIDQFEEAFTLVKDEAIRDHFLDSLYAAIVAPRSRLRVVATLRADFYDRPLQRANFGELLRDCTVLVLPLNAEELEAAIREPAKQGGIEVDPALVAEIITDVKDEPGALPLLQYALTELYERRQGKVLTPTVYRMIGGALGALARRADEIYNALPESRQALTHQLFLRLVQLGEGAEDTRRRARMDELVTIGNPDEITGVISIFARSRLLTLDRDPATRVGTVELAHEALLREWALLRQWLNDGREDVRQQRRLAQRAKEWQDAAQDDSFLLYGANLANIEAWIEHSDIALTTEEQHYIRVSQSAHQQRIAEDTARQRREEDLQKQSIQRLRILFATVAVAAVVGFILSLIAFNESNDAQDAAEDARLALQTSDANALAADNARATSDANADRLATQIAVEERSNAQIRSLSLVANAQNAAQNGDPDLALTLALQALDMTEPPQLATQFVETLALQGGTLRRIPLTDSSAWRVAQHPQGTLLAISSGASPYTPFDVETALYIVERESGEIVHTIPTGTILGLAFHPMDGTLLTSSRDGIFQIWDVETGEERDRFTAQETENGILRIAISPDGNTFLAGDSNGILRLRDAATGDVIWETSEHRGAIGAVAYIPNGRQQAITASEDGSLILWNLETGELIRRLGVETGAVSVVAIAPDGSHFIYDTPNGDLVYVDLNNLLIVHLLQGHEDTVLQVAFSPDGDSAISASEDGSLILWNLTRGTIIERFNGHQYTVSDVIYTTEGIYSVSFDGTMREWSPYAIEGAISNLSLPQNMSAIANFENLIAVGGGDLNITTSTTQNPILIIDTNTETIIAEFDGHNGTITSLVFSPDGSQLLSAGDDGQIVVWDVGSGECIWQVDDNDTRAQALFSPDGTQIISSGYQDQVRLWDRESGELVETITTDQNQVYPIAVHPDGEQLAIGAFDGTLTIVSLTDVDTDPLSLEGHPRGILSLTWSGDQLISGDFEGNLLIWDTTTGENLGEWQGHETAVVQLRSSDEQQVVLSVGLDIHLYIWDATSGRLLDRYDLPMRTSAATFGATDEQFFTAAQSLTTWQRPIEHPLEDTVAWLRENRYIRALTCEERVLYLVEDNLTCDE